MKNEPRLANRVALALIVTAWMSAVAAAPASAGCGCDHPPPLHGTVYPRFASAGDPITISSGAFGAPGTWLKIDGRTVTEYLPPTADGTMRAIVPAGVNLGPAKIEVFSRSNRLLETIPASAFTHLPQPLPVYEQEGTFLYKRVELTVDANGTFLLPFDLAHVIRPMQFHVTFTNLPLRFTADDLTYYNKDEYNLKLFSLLVSGPNDYQWGAYYGSTIGKASDASRSSDVMGYWRHEFESYTMAHMPGGSFAADANGLHPDGTPHVDHNALVLAVRGNQGDPSRPYDPRFWQRLRPGRISVDVEIRQVFSNDPVALEALSSTQRATLERRQFEVWSNAIAGVTRFEPANPDGPCGGD